MRDPLVPSLAALLLVSLAAGCASYDPSWGPTVHKPMFRGAPTLETLAPGARLPDAQAAPLPRFKVAWLTLRAQNGDTVYGHTVVRPGAGADGYADVESEQVQDTRCNPRNNRSFIALGGMIVSAMLETVFSPSCRSLGTVYTRIEYAEVKDVAGHLFPLAVGNSVTFSVRVLFRGVNTDQFSNPVDRLFGDIGDRVDTGMSDKEFWRHERYTVVAHQDHYRLTNGKDVGEIFVVREFVITPDKGETLVGEWYFAPRLDWPVVSKWNDGLVEELEGWQ